MADKIRCVQFNPETSRSCAETRAQAEYLEVYISRTKLDFLVKAYNVSFSRFELLPDNFRYLLFI